MAQGDTTAVIGKRVGNYVVERTLAQGGMGSVFVARHPALDREAAVKFLGHDLEAPPELTRRFLDEARITASLHHPNIVDIFDFGELDGRLYYIMELLKGRDLSVLLRQRRRLPPRECVDILIQITSGLAAAHAVGVVHRDLKPANVFVLEGDTPRIKLMDFGIAKVLSTAGEHTSYGQIMGTPRYMSPEQALGQADRISPQSDIYSLGIIAYEMLAGVAPFETESPVMLLIMHVRDPVKPLLEVAPDCPPHLASLVEHCLKKEPAERPRSANAVLEQLAEILRSIDDNSQSRSTSPNETPDELPLDLVARPRLAMDDTLRRSIAPGASPLADAPLVEKPSSATPLPPRDAGKQEPKPISSVPEMRRAPSAKADALPLSPVAPKPEAKAKQSPSAPVAVPAKPTTVPPKQKAASIEEVAAAEFGDGISREHESKALIQSVTAIDPRAPEGRTETVSLTETDRNVLNKLLMRMQKKGDFPAFVQNVGEVSKRADCESSYSAEQLGGAILKDYALTAKLLRIVNSAYANRFGGKIYSVQHAIVILGFERVRQLALSISLFKNQGKKSHNERISESAINSLVSGEIARQLHYDADLDDPEQAVICTMFRNLGRHLVLVYLPELYDEILTLQARENIGLNAASERVLGISMHKLGVGIAERWRLPPRMISAMAVVPERTGKLYRPEDRLSALAEFSNQLCEIVASDLDGNTRSQALTALTGKHKYLLSFNTDDMAELLTKVQESFEHRYNSLLGPATKTSRFSRNLSQLISTEAQSPEASAGESGKVTQLASAPSPEVKPVQLVHTPPEQLAAPKVAPVVDGSKMAAGAKPKRAVERVLLAKVAVDDPSDEGTPEPTEFSIFLSKLDALKAEVLEHGGSDASLHALLSAISELLKVPRLLLLKATANHRELVILAGIGEDIDGLSKELALPLAPARAAVDPFSVAYHVNRPQLIDDCFSQRITSVLSPRYYELLGSASLLLLNVPGKSAQNYVLSADLDSPHVLPSQSAVKLVLEARPFLTQLAASLVRS